MRSALFALFARAALLAGIVKTATDKACNECKTLGQLGLVCVLTLGHKCSFRNSHFLILVVRNDKRSSGIGGKTSNCLSRNCLYYCYLELRFRYQLFSVSSEPVIVVFC